MKKQRYIFPGFMLVGGASAGGGGIPLVYELMFNVNQDFTGFRFTNDGSDVTIYWGDGSSDIVTGGTNVHPTHTYADPGNYDVGVDGTTITRFRFQSSGGFSAPDTLNSISKIPATLTQLNIEGQTIFTSLNISGAAALEVLDVGITALTAITGLADCTALDTVEIQASSLSGTLDFSTAISMEFIGIRESPDIDTIIVTGLVLLSEVDFSNCGLTTLDISTCISLTNVNVADNLLSPTVINQTLQDLDSFSLSGGVIALHQRIASAPSSGGQDSIDNLIANGYTIENYNVDPAYSWTQPGGNSLVCDTRGGISNAGYGGANFITRLTDFIPQGIRYFVGDAVWIIFGETGAAANVYYSTDGGATWTANNSIPTGIQLRGMAYDGTKYSFVGDEGAIYAVTDITTPISLETTITNLRTQTSQSNYIYSSDANLLVVGGYDVVTDVATIYTAQPIDLSVWTLQSTGLATDPGTGYSEVVYCFSSDYILANETRGGTGLYKSITGTSWTNVVPSTPVFNLYADNDNAVVLGTDQATQTKVYTTSQSDFATWALRHNYASDGFGIVQSFTFNDDSAHALALCHEPNATYNVGASADEVTWVATTVAT